MSKTPPPIPCMFLLEGKLAYAELDRKTMIALVKSGIDIMSLHIRGRMFVFANNGFSRILRSEELLSPDSTKNNVWLASTEGSMSLASHHYALSRFKKLHYAIYQLLALTK